jgi:putative oxidoreductase
MTSLAQLIIRVIVGGLLAGHGAQKLFGSFGGSGVEGTAGWMESMNLRPGRDWALAAGLSEFGGGILTALGALNPLGPILAAGAMLMATLKVHHGKPIWGQAGGAELPVTNMAVLAALLLAGPGRFSVDRALGIRIPRWAALTALLGTIGVTVVAATDSGLADELEAERVAAEDEVTPELDTDVPDAPEPSTLIAAG